MVPAHSLESRLPAERRSGPFMAAVVGEAGPTRSRFALGKLGPTIVGQQLRRLGFAFTVRPCRQVSLERGLLLLAVLFVSAQVWHNRAELFRRSADADLSWVSVEENCVPTLSDPWDPIAKASFAEVEPLHCKRFQAELTYVNESGWLLRNISAAWEAKLRSVRCAYQCIFFDRVLGDLGKNVTDWRPLPDGGVRLDCEFVQVSCQNGRLNVPVYTNFHNTIIRLDDAAVPYSEERIDVFILVLDSVSRSNFIRCMPKLRKFLLDEYATFSFDAYNRVGDESYPNGMAIVTGQKKPFKAFALNYSNDVFIWKRFADRGYVTLLLEDMPDWALMRRSPFKGFKSQPTDHYYSPFISRLNGNMLRLKSSQMCTGNKPTHSLHLNYAKAFLRQYDGHRSRFAIAWISEVTHNWLNMAQLWDQDLIEFFRDVKPYLRNAVTVVMADHGMRFGSFRHTWLGRIEENNPLFLLLLPTSIAQRRPALKARLQENSKLLVTHYDLHESLRQLADATWQTLESEAAEERTSPLSTGVSIFQRIPKNRSCQEAGVPIEHCSCRKGSTLPVNSELAINAAHEMVDFLNKRMDALEPNRCVRLRLHRVLYASTLRAYESSKEAKARLTDCILAIETKPGDANFEAMVRFSGQHLAVVGEVSRINRYGNQSACVQTLEMRKYCYCYENPQ